MEDEEFDMNLEGFGSPNLPPGMSRDQHREISRLLGGASPDQEVPDVEPEPLPDRPYYPVGTALQLTKEARKTYSSPKRGEYCVVVESYRSLQWQMSEGSPGHSLEPYNLRVSMVIKNPKSKGLRGQESSPVLLYFMLSNDLEPYTGARSNDLLESYTERARRDFVVGDKVQLDGTQEQHKRWPQAPHYGIIADFFSYVSYLPPAGRSGAPVDPFDCVVQVVIPSGDTKSFMMFSGDLKTYVPPADAEQS